MRQPRNASATSIILALHVLAALATCALAAFDEPSSTWLDGLGKVPLFLVNFARFAVCVLPAFVFPCVALALAIRRRQRVWIPILPHVALSLMQFFVIAEIA